MKQAQDYYSLLVIERKRRFAFVFFAAVLSVLFVTYEAIREWRRRPIVLSVASNTDATRATDALNGLAVKGRAPKTGYSRQKFSQGWGQVGTCDMRNWILHRDLEDVAEVSETDCTVISGVLEYDPYTGNRINFLRTPGTSGAVQIDHIVAVSDAWQKGAQQLTQDKRYAFYNDPLNLLAVDGPANVDKGDADAGTWMPPNKAYRCKYIARQIAVKVKYLLWVTAAERDAMKRVLRSCPDQMLPEVSRT